MKINHCPASENKVNGQQVTIVELTVTEAQQLALNLLQQIVDPTSGRKEFFSADSKQYFSVQVTQPFPVPKRLVEKTRRTK